MGLNKNDIEKLAVSAVETQLAMSPLLSPVLSRNDKEPSWDGHINVYNNASQSKKDLIGVVTVQIKGTENNDFSKDEISFRMSITDLKNYLHNGGTILFVVYLRNNGREHKIYFQTLAPIKLRNILKEAKGRKSKTVKLKSFPEENNAKADIVINFLENSHRQASFSEAKLPTLKDLQNNGNERLLTFFSSVADSDPVTAFLNNETYWYTMVEGSAIVQPVDGLMVKKWVTKSENVKISINGEKIYSKVGIIRTKDSYTYQIGGSLLIKVNLNVPNALALEYKNSNLLRVQARDLEFMLSWIKSGKFDMDGKEIPFDYENVSYTDFEVEAQGKKLEYLKKVVKAIDILGYAGDIDLSKLTEEEAFDLDILVTAFVEKKPVTNLKCGVPRIIGVQIQDAAFMLVFEPQKDMEAYDVLDFFKVNLLDYRETNEEGEEFILSQYLILTENELLILNNLDVDVLLPSFKNLSMYKETSYFATDFLTRLLKAYDLSDGKRNDLLDAALDFAKWLRETAETDDLVDSQLNLLQTIKRMRALTEEEQKEIYSIIEVSNTDEICKIEGYLLLDAHPMAHHYFKNLSEEQKEQIKNMPIYHFWGDKNG